MTETNRRRFIGVAAAATAAALLPGAARAREPLHVWNGVALGARASLRLHHPDEAEAQRLIDRCVSEIGRLERAFSLYRPDSVLSALNTRGEVQAPPLDFVRLLGDCRRFSAETGGAFDITVQPLWRLFARHFSSPDADPAGPPADAVAEAAALADWHALRVEAGRVSFDRPGMEATLNGIAQGFITDRVADFLRSEGLEHVLIDLGETRALGPRPDGRPWRAGIADPAAEAALAARLDLEAGALATSAPTGFAFDPAGRFHHLIDPRIGGPRAGYRSVSVLAPEATTADALSTAFMQMEEAEIERIVASRPRMGALLIGEGGRMLRIGAFPA